MNRGRFCVQKGDIQEHISLGLFTSRPPRGSQQSWVDRRTFLQFKADSTGAELNLRLYQLDERLTPGGVSGGI